MVRLRDLKNGLYQVHYRGGSAFEGPELPIFEKALEWGVQKIDLSRAVAQLKLHSHDFADFGNAGFLLYTKKNP